MNTRTTLFFSIGLGLLTALTACKSTAVPSGEVTYLSTSNQGDLMKISARGYGANERAIIADAERRAFETLLFSGLTGSSVQYPMVNDPNARQTNKDYFKKLLDEQGYRSYLATPGMADKVNKDKRSGKKSALVTMQVNVLTLRRELERQKLTRKFGL